MVLSSCNMPRGLSHEQQTSIAETVAAGREETPATEDPNGQTPSDTPDPGAPPSDTPEPADTPDLDTPTPSDTPIPCNRAEFVKDVNVPDARWAAARALRNRSDFNMKPLRDHIEGQFINNLTEIASDPNVYLDTRWEAVLALSLFIHHKSEVASLLGDLLVQDDDSTLRRFYLDALVKLGQPNESKDALLKAVEDSDAQIRLVSPFLAENVRAVTGM